MELEEFLGEVLEIVSREVACVDLVELHDGFLDLLETLRGSGLTRLAELTCDPDQFSREKKVSRPTERESVSVSLSTAWLCRAPIKIVRTFIPREGHPSPSIVDAAVPNPPRESHFELGGPSPGCSNRG